MFSHNYLVRLNVSGRKNMVDLYKNDVGNDVLKINALDG